MRLHALQCSAHRIDSGSDPSYPPPPLSSFLLPYRHCSAARIASTVAQIGVARLDDGGAGQPAPVEALQRPPDLRPSPPPPPRPRPPHNQPCGREGEREGVGEGEGEGEREEGGGG